MFEKYDNKCARCGWAEINPTSGKIPLEVEHIDGNYKNTTEENLTLLCPNCHALTPTYRSLNIGHGRKERNALK
jgi:Zn finger protein HypA/HybF involved in hydrogenase expression